MPETYESYSDARLAGLVRSGDPEAFAQLSARYLGLVRGKARLFEKEAALDQEDLWQEGFLGLYAAATSFDPEGAASFATYANACVYRRMVSAVRRQGTGGNRPLNESLPLDADAPQPEEAGPAALLELRERFQAVQREMDQALSPRERQVLGWYLNGYRREELPGKTGLTLKAVDNALYRARKKLQKLQEQGV